MEHVAIVKKSWRVIDKILGGDKVIESRWYKSRIAPWDKIISGETVYFKNSGEPVTVVAKVEKVLQFSDLSPTKIKQILTEFGGVGGICVSDPKESFERNKDKRYCILVFLKNVKRIKPFEVDKRGFGNMCAWLSCGKLVGYVGTALNVRKRKGPESMSGSD